MRDNPTAYITPAEAAAELGVHLKRVQALLREGRIPEAQKWAGRWMIARKFTVLPGTRGPNFQKIGKPKA